MQIIGSGAQTKRLNKNMVVYYHGGQCRDGFCAGWLFAMAMNEDKHEASGGANEIDEEIQKRVIPIQHNTPIEAPEFIPSRMNHVIFVDVVPSAEVMLAVAQWAESITILDHHKTAVRAISEFTGTGIPGESNLGSIEFSVNVRVDIGKPTRPVSVKFDKSQSGAMLAMRFLTERGYKFHDAVTRIVEYVQDRDLWRHELTHSREFNAYLRSIQMQFADWHGIWSMMSNRYTDSILSAGQAILRSQQEIIEQHVRNAREIGFRNHRVAIVNATVAILASEIGEAMLKRFPDCDFAVTFFDTNDDVPIRQYQLRARVGCFDVGAFAAACGGGGHAAAAGFRVNLRDIAEYESGKWVDDEESF